MAVHPAPTAPKQQLDQQAARLMQPNRTPWGRLFLLIIFFSILISGGVIFGWAWLQRAYPNLTVLRWLPSVTTTTVRERTTETGINIPSAVAHVAETVSSLAISHDQNPIYTNREATATVVPLSSNGWWLGWAEAVSSDPWVILTQTGGPDAVTQRVADPASHFLFLKVKAGGQPPVTLTTDPLESGSRVWVIQSDVRQVTILERRLGSPNDLLWLASDTQQQWWSIDPAVTVRPGSLVVNDRGRLVGLIGTEGRVWPTDVVDSALKDVFQQATISRPSLGLFALDRRLIVDSTQETARGALIGADDPLTALVPGGAAERAGLQSGDIIMELDHQAIEFDVWHSLLRYKPGQTITITYIRDGVRREATIELGTLRP